MARAAAYAWLALVLAFILAPAGFVVFDSFNAATSFPSPFEGATLHWYAALAEHPEFLSSAWTSVELAVLAASIATVAGFLAAWGLAGGRIPGRDAITTTLMGPLLVPELVVGLAILQIVGALHLSLGLPVLVAAHAVFVLPIALRLSLSGFAAFDLALEEAARDLGARRWQVLWHVTLPLLRPSVTAGFVLSAVLSFVNLPLSMFLTTAQTSTLPVIAFAYMESRIDPMIAAVATLVMLVAAAIAVLIDRVLRIRLTE
ncbi:MAG TPA: ABC transporter permease [Rhodopila sp.]|uniref:ABC transporter permease n=1 Tax=Rhodopila sp. TaxID=2480087 RepID=UPI002CFE9A9C|nr:ABC transporter permease [Rhodopila sp.]HVY15541.1 ABC transporter permease [Rhodopila sp.]